MIQRPFVINRNFNIWLSHSTSFLITGRMRWWDLHAGLRMRHGQHGRRRGSMTDADSAEADTAEVKQQQDSGLPELDRARWGWRKLRREQRRKSRHRVRVRGVKQRTWEGTWLGETLRSRRKARGSAAPVPEHPNSSLKIRSQRTHALETAPVDKQL